MGSSAFPSAHLMSYTFDTTGPLVGYGRRMPFAGHVSGTIVIDSTLSYSSVRTRARAGVMCASDPPRLASFTVFHIATNCSELTLSSETLYENYVRSAESNIVQVDRLVPESFPHLRRTYARGPCSLATRYHKACVNPSLFPWYAHTGEYCDWKEEIIARF